MSNLSGSDLKRNICETNISKVNGDLPEEESIAVTSSFQRCPTAKSSGDLKQKEKALEGGLTTVTSQISLVDAQSAVILYFDKVS